MEHLLNDCIFTSILWDNFATIFRQIDKDKGSIINTLINVWKERNNRIFKNVKSSSQRLLEQILRQLNETVSTIV